VRLEVLREVARDGGPSPGGAARAGGALPPDEQLHKTRTRWLPPPPPPRNDSFHQMMYHIMIRYHPPDKACSRAGLTRNPGTGPKP
jgi:hypothetical protein